jgi:hypothetical protein
VKNAFAHRKGEVQQFDVDALKPLWAGAYTDLGRPQLVDRLEIVL